MTPVFVVTFGDVVGMLLMGIGLIALLALWLFIQVPIWWKKARCRHDGKVTETRSCEAICCQCGKNLGSIADWENRHAR